MAEERVGILIQAKDAVSSVLSTIAKNAGSGFAAVGAAAKFGEGGIHAFAGAIRTIDHAMGLAKKAAMVLKEAFEQTVGKALEYRSANDPAVQSLKQFTDAANLAKARVGDALLPVLVGLSKTFTPIIERITAWVNVNRVLIATKFAEWLAQVGNIAITVVAKGILYVSRAWAGWLEIIQVVKIGVNEFFKKGIEGAGLFLKANAELASALGQDGLAAKLGEAHNALVPLWEEFDRGSTESQNALDEQITKQNELEATLGKVEGAVRKVWGQATVAMMKAASNATAGYNVNLKESEERLKKLTDEAKKWDTQLRAFTARDVQRQGEVLAGETKKYERIAELSEKSAIFQDQQLTAVSDAYASAAETMGGAMGEAFAGMITGSEGAGKAMLTSVVRAAMGAITAHALTAAAGSASSQAAIPVIGPVLAAAAMATMSGLVMGLISQLPSFHAGGVVGSDAPRVPGGRDDERLVRALVGETFTPPGRATSGGGVNVTIFNKNQVNQSSADTKKNAVQLRRLIRRQVALGY